LQALPAQQSWLFAPQATQLFPLQTVWPVQFPEHTPAHVAGRQRHVPPPAGQFCPMGQSAIVQQLAPARHTPPQFIAPLLHCSPQTPPSHVAIPFVGVAQGMQLVPQVLVLVSSAHALPHWWYWALHEKPQVLLPQVAVPFGTRGHDFVQPPQWFGSLVRSAHVPLQFVFVEGQPLEHE
jgi:hypothetical protein